MAQIPKCKLYYFDIPGKAEFIRLACVYGGVELEDIRLTGEEYASMKESGDIPGQVPYALFGYIDEKQVVHETAVSQSIAILKCVGKLADMKQQKANSFPAAAAKRFIRSASGTLVDSKMNPDDPFLAAKVDEVFGLVNDLLEPVGCTLYRKKFGLEPHRNDKEKNKHMKKFADEILPPILARIELLLSTSTKCKTAAKSGSGFGWMSPSKSAAPAANGTSEEDMLFCCGTPLPTVADFYLCVALTNFKDTCGPGKRRPAIPETILDPYPVLNALITKFYNLDAIKAYYS